MPEQNAAPSPLLLFDAINSYQRTAAIRAGIELDLFTGIGEGHADPADLARRCEAAERGVRILCDCLVAAGFLTRQDGAYGLTPDTATFLDRRSPAYMGGAIEFLLSPDLMEGFENLTEAVRRGGTALSREGTVEPDHPVWVRFARAMMPLMAMPADQLTTLAPLEAGRRTRVLDIAAGHGLFGIAFARRFPDAEVTALDWPRVLEVARANAEAAGVADRHHLLPGSAFEVDFGTGYDLVLLTNFLHHFDPPTCEGLLRRVRAALAPGGRVVTLEFVPNEDRVSPPGPAMFALTMLATTGSGDAYPFSELDRMFRNAGFSRSEIHPVPPRVQSAVISYP